MNSTHYALFQHLFAEASAVPYDRTAIQRTRAVLYRMANLYNLPVPLLTAQLKNTRAAIREAAAKLAKDEPNAAAVATMGSIGTSLGWIASHVHAPLDELNIPQLSADIYNFLVLLSVLDKLPTAKAA